MRVRFSSAWGQSGSGLATKGRSWIYSPLADLALLIGIVAATFGCVSTAGGALLALFTGEFLIALVLAPMYFLLQLGILIVLLRVQDIGRP